VRHVEKRSHYVLLGLDFSPLGAECGAVFLEIGVGLLAHANSCSVIAFHLQFIRFITNKYFGFVQLVEMNHDVSTKRHLWEYRTKQSNRAD
jgi:hypothetical protein